MKNILGLDLGCNSIGWAMVREAEGDHERSEIVGLGVRPIPLSTKERTNFEKGKAITINAERRRDCTARRNLQRYKLRRKCLIEVLMKHGIITADTPLTEIGKDTTHQTLQLRAKAAREQIGLEELARVLLMINKKRGYKSSRKAKSAEEGVVIDSMEVAKVLYHEQFTPGQYVYRLLKDKKRHIPDFYRSDLQAEFDRIWQTQQRFYPNVLTDDLYEKLKGKNKTQTGKVCEEAFQIVGIKFKGKRDEQRLKRYQCRVDGLLDRALDLELLAIALQEVNGEIGRSSGYLGEVSDRSKALYFNGQTVGEYQWAQLAQNPHTSLRNQVFYRQDYLDEFEQIWETQAQYYPQQLTQTLKDEVRDVIIFYQRKLKSQKGRIAFCEFESKEVEVRIGDKIVKKIRGNRVAPKSSPLFQEFKIWQILNNVVIRPQNIASKEGVYELDLPKKEKLFGELNVKGKLKEKQILALLGCGKGWELNYEELEGNNTNNVLYNAYLDIIELEGYDPNIVLGLKKAKETVKIEDAVLSVAEVKKAIKQIFEDLGINSAVLDFDATAADFDKQPAYQLWHLLYSYEGDDSLSGNETLYRLLGEKFGFKREHAQILANIRFQEEYGSLSARAIRKIMPYIKEHKFSKACENAGYRHSKASITKEENEVRELKDKLEILEKNSLRQPVVEQILNQMVNLVNTLIDKHSERDEQGQIIKPFRFDEIRIELARELKHGAKERKKIAANITKATAQNEKIREILKSEYKILYPTTNDILRYRLYEELKDNGYKELYEGRHIPREKLFSKDIEIEHIVPRSRLFDDSFSNKTLTYSEINKKKADRTGYDYLTSLGPQKLEAYLACIAFLEEKKVITRAKAEKLRKRGEDIGDGFIERDLRESQYIAKKAKDMLLSITKNVVSTSGKITDRLREDWGLTDIMRELNLPKYRLLGLTEFETRRDGRSVEVIKDWTKRNDQRHHAMDALTVAFTKHAHIQYLNHLNARKDESQELHKSVMGIQDKEMEKRNGKDYRFKAPMSNFRAEAKKYLEGLFVSYKTKNKVVTRSTNRPSKGKLQETLTPRGQLHIATLYGRRLVPMEKETTLDKKFTSLQAERIIHPKQKEIVLAHLQHFGTPKVAFDSKTLKKNPILWKGEPLTSVLCYQDISTSRDPITTKLKVEKVIDPVVREILQKRLAEFGGDPKKAFADLDNNPIWLNKEAGLSIKRVTISGKANVIPLRTKKDHLGKEILDKRGNTQPTDYTCTENNHHLAVYRDRAGKLQRQIVSLFEAVVRIQNNLPVVDKQFNAELGWKFVFTLKKNEMFILPDKDSGFNPQGIDLFDPKNKALISPHLFRVQKVSYREFVFSHHLETKVADDEIKKNNKALMGKTYVVFTSPNSLENLVKVRINHIGDIVSVGEY